MSIDLPYVSNELFSRSITFHSVALPTTRHYVARDMTSCAINAIQPVVDKGAVFYLMPNHR